MGLIGLHTFTSNMTKMPISKVPNYILELQDKRT